MEAEERERGLFLWSFGSLKSVLVIITLGTLLLFFTSVSFGCILFTYISRNNHNVENTRLENYKYQYSHYDAQSNEESFGIVSMSEQLNNGEFTSYEGDDGNIALVSDFGSTEYECSGICFCDDNNYMDERRISSSVSLRNGIYYLVAALSSTIAYNKAKEYFENECSERLEGICSTSSIVSQVENCDPVIDSSSSTTDSSHVSDPSTSEVGEKTNDIRKYWCYGNCMRKNFKKKQPSDMAKSFGCEHLTASGEIVTDLIKVKLDGSFNTVARSIFQSRFLTPMCKERSKDSYYYFYKSIMTGRWVKINLCVATRAEYFLNPSVRCRQIYPPFKRTGPKPKPIETTEIVKK